MSLWLYKMHFYYIIFFDSFLFLSKLRVLLNF